MNNKNIKWIDDKGNLWNDPKSLEWIEYSRSDVINESTNTHWHLIPGWFIGQENDVWKSRHMKPFLKHYGRTIEEWYCRFILNLDHVPTCEAPGCNNTVPLRFGKIFGGLQKYCCFEHQFIPGSPHGKWTDQRRLNESLGKIRMYKEKPETLKKKSDFLKIPKNAAHMQKMAIMKKSNSIYGFYLARTESGKLKFGVSKNCSFEWRMKSQELYNRDKYLAIHGLFTTDNITAAELEYELKSNFNYSEYLDWDQFKSFKIKLKEYIEKYSDKLNKI